MSRCCDATRQHLALAFSTMRKDTPGEPDPTDNRPTDDHPTGPPLVQSLTRAFDLLECMVDAGGEAGLSELAEASGIPLPTIHRLMRTLTHRGYARQERSRRYALGPRLIRLGDSASRLLGSWSQPFLAELVDLTGETANLALRDGDEVVYVAQEQSHHSVRMFTEVGRRVPLHTTGVGKAILAQLTPAEVDEVLTRTALRPATDRSVTDPAELRAQLEAARADGYATDEGEYEIGVSCVAVPLSFTLAALSVSGPAARLDHQTRLRIAPLMRDVAGDLSRTLEHDAPS